MPKLKCTTETVIKVQYYDLNEFIQEITGQKDYDCVAGEEWDNDSNHRLVIDDKPLDTYDAKCWDKFKSGGEQGYMLRIILNAMCVDKIIPPGTYLINVS